MTDGETTWILDALRAWLRCGADPVVCPAELSAERLGDRLEQNRLLPLFQQLPTSFPMTAGWDRFHARMADAYRRSLLQALRQLQSGTRLMESLRQAGIPSLAVRGPFLAADVYGDPAARIAADIDILVPRSARRRAWQVCRTMDFRSLDWECPLWPLDAHRIHWRIQRSDEPVVCELHWTVEPVYGVMTLRYDALFDRPSRLNKSGFEWYQPCPDRMLVLLCLHTGRHFADAQSAHRVTIRSGADALDLQMLFRWLDVALFMREYAAQLDWDWIAGQTADRRIAQSMAVSLEGVRDWLGVALPDAAVRYLPVWAGAAIAQRSSATRRRIEGWWDRKAGPTVGLAETSLENVLYFLLPHALFFAPAHGVRLLLLRMGHGVAAATRLLGAFLLWSGFTAITAARRAWRRKSPSFPIGQTFSAGDSP